jgi:hypothetical protein
MIVSKASYRFVLEVKLSRVYNAVIRENVKWNKSVPFYFVRQLCFAGGFYVNYYFIDTHYV